MLVQTGVCWGMRYIGIRDGRYRPRRYERAGCAGVLSEQWRSDRCMRVVRGRIRGVLSSIWGRRMPFLELLGARTPFATGRPLIGTWHSRTFLFPTKKLFVARGVNEL